MDLVDPEFDQLVEAYLDIALGRRKIYSRSPDDTRLGAIQWIFERYWGKNPDVVLGMLAGDEGGQAGPTLADLLALMGTRGNDGQTDNGPRADDPGPGPGDGPHQPDDQG
jgi:hypothetical protein